MRFNTALLSLLAATAAVGIAIPGPDSEETTPLYLDNGSTTVDVNAAKLKIRKNAGECGGSSRCSNKQARKDDLQAALKKLSDTIYQSGGSKSGVCHKHIGIFVQGKDAKGQDCTATGHDLQTAVDQLQADGCQVCGWLNFNDVGQLNTGSCKIKVDYVESC